jgi:hypothetical protein
MCVEFPAWGCGIERSREVVGEVAVADRTMARAAIRVRVARAAILAIWPGASK